MTVPFATHPADALPRHEIYPITQATRARFPALHFNRSVLFFIQNGCKCVQTPDQGEIIGKAGDLMIFPHGAMVTMENRPRMNGAYRATGLGLDQVLVDEVFQAQTSGQMTRRVQVVRAPENLPGNAPDKGPDRILGLLRATLNDPGLPPEIYAHRLREPLIWLRARGVILPTQITQDIVGQLRTLLERDLSHPWRADEVAARLALSPATLRRRLARAGHSFSKLLMNARLEHGLSRLQSSQDQISQIALDCGFKTPSHFSDAFRNRFAIRPIDIRLAAV
jgi:AraC-like DNA-binding protein